MTRPTVTWFFWTMAPTEMAKVNKRENPRTVPARLKKLIKSWGSIY